MDRSQPDSAGYSRCARNPENQRWGKNMMRKCLIVLSLLLPVLPARGQVAKVAAPPHLALERIASEPFLIRWDSTNTLPVGTNLLGFVVVKAEELTESYTTPEGKTVTRDRPLVATLKRGDRTLKLFWGKELPFIDWFALLKSTDDGTAFKARVGDTFRLGPRTFRLLSVDTQTVACVVADAETGVRTTIEKKK